jgi:hypothetical protein
LKVVSFSQLIGRERDGRVGPDADMKIVDEVLKNMT